MTSPCVFYMPVPPSLNGIYANRKGGRVKTDEYKAWKEAAALMISALRIPPFTERVGVSIEMPSNHKGDIDNRIKPALDAIVAAGLIQNDSKKHIKRVSAEWVDRIGDTARVSIEVAA